MCATRDLPRLPQLHDTLDIELDQLEEMRP